MASKTAFLSDEFDRMRENIHDLYVRVSRTNPFPLALDETILLLCNDNEKIFNAIQLASQNVVLPDSYYEPHVTLSLLDDGFKVRLGFRGQSLYPRMTNVFEIERSDERIIKIRTWAKKVIDLNTRFTHAAQVLNYMHWHMKSPEEVRYYWTAIQMLATMGNNNPIVAERTATLKPIKNPIVFPPAMRETLRQTAADITMANLLPKDISDEDWQVVGNVVGYKYQSVEHPFMGSYARLSLG